MIRAVVITVPLGQDQKPDLQLPPSVEVHRKQGRIYLRHQDRFVMVRRLGTVDIGGTPNGVWCGTANESAIAALSHLGAGVRILADVWQNATRRQWLIDHGVKVDVAIAVWSLQHCAKVEEDIALITYALKPGGSLFVCNLLHSAVPTDAGWIDTGFEIKTVLAKTFTQIAIEPVSPDDTSKGIAKVAFIGMYRKAA